MDKQKGVKRRNMAKILSAKVNDDCLIYAAAGEFKEAERKDDFFVYFCLEMCYLLSSCLSLIYLIIVDMEEYNFSALLVPMPAKAGDRCRVCLTVIDSENEHVDVIAFNTLKREEMKSLLEEEIVAKKSHKDSRSDRLTDERLSEMIGDSEYEREPPRQMLESLNDFWRTKFAPEDVIYLTWGCFPLNIKHLNYEK